MKKNKKLICVLCGEPWISYKNRCECGGFCSWGYEKGKPLSYTVNRDGRWKLNPPPNFKN